MIKTIEFKGQTYPELQSTGNAARWCRPFAEELCKGRGLDIGYCKPEWKFPGAIGIEPSINPMFDAMNLPEGKFDYIHSSHCLEHVKESWENVLDYWLSKLVDGGVLFLYLPHASQLYWHTSSNRKHVHNLDAIEMSRYLRNTGNVSEVIYSGHDLNNSFYLVAQMGFTPNKCIIDYLNK